MQGNLISRLKVIRPRKEAHVFVSRFFFFFFLSEQCNKMNNYTHVTRFLFLRSIRESALFAPVARMTDSVNVILVERQKTDNKKCCPE